MSNGSHPNRASRCIPGDRGMTDRWHLPHTGPGRCIPRDRGMSDGWHLAHTGPGQCIPRGRGMSNGRRLYGRAGGAARSCQPPSHGSTSHRDQIAERMASIWRVMIWSTRPTLAACEYRSGSEPARRRWHRCARSAGSRSASCAVLPLQRPSSTASSAQTQTARRRGRASSATWSCSGSRKASVSI